MGMLSKVAAKLDGQTLSAHQASVLGSFYRDLLEDEPCLPQILAGLEAISRMAELPASQATSIVLGVLKHVDMQKFAQPVRHHVFVMLNNLLSRDRNVAAAAVESQDIIKGVVTIMDGEKDPRNLMVGFFLLETLATNFDISGHTSEVFDAAYCYFPVTFRAPAPGGKAALDISSEDLKLRLRSCLTCNPLFCEFLAPSLVEKINAASISVKKDALATFQLAFERWPRTPFEPYSQKIWNGLKFELWDSSDEDVTFESLNVITALSKNTLENGGLSALVSTVSKECLDQFRQNNPPSIKTCGAALAAISAAGKPALELVTAANLPSVFVIYQDTDVLSKQEAILTAVNCLLNANCTIYPVANATEPTILASFSDKFFKAYAERLMSPEKSDDSIKSVAIKGLTFMLKTKGMFDESSTRLAIQFFGELSIDGSREVSEDAMQALAELSDVMPSQILEIVLPMMLAKLPETEASSEIDRYAYRAMLGRIAKLCQTRVVTRTVIVRVMSKIDTLSSLDPVANEAYIKSLVQTIQLILMEHEEKNQLELVYAAEDILGHMLTRLVVPLVDPDMPKALSRPSIVQHVAQVCMICTRSLPVEQQERVADSVSNIFLGRSRSKLIHAEYATLVANKFLPFHDSISDDEAAAISVYIAVDGALTKQVINRVPFKGDFLDMTLDLALERASKRDQRSFFELFGNRLNKCTDDEALKLYLDVLVPKLWNGLDASREAERTFSALTMAWIIKALSMRSYQLAFDLLPQITERLTGKAGSALAQAMALVFTEDRVLCKKNHAVVRLLYKQRIFTILFSLLNDQLQTIRSTDTVPRENLLTVLAYLVGFTPVPVMLPKISELLPRILLTLDLSEPSLKTTASNVIAVVCAENPDVLVSHLQSILPKLLKTATNVHSSPVVCSRAGMKLL